VELHLSDAAGSGLVNGGFQEGFADALAASGFGHHQAQVGDMGARGMRVARDR